MFARLNASIAVRNQLLKMTEVPKMNLPSLEAAMRDLEEMQLKYKISSTKMSILTNRIEKIKLQKQNFERDIEDQNNLVRHYENIYADMISKIQVVIAKQHNGKIVTCLTKEKIKQVEKKYGCSDINMDLYNEMYNKHTHQILKGMTPQNKATPDIKIQSKSSLQNLKEDLLLQKIQLEKLIEYT